MSGLAELAGRPFERALMGVPRRPGNGGRSLPLIEQRGGCRMGAGGQKIVCLGGVAVGSRQGRRVSGPLPAGGNVAGAEEREQGSHENKPADEPGAGVGSNSRQHFLLSGETPLHGTNYSHDLIRDKGVPPAGTNIVLTSGSSRRGREPP